MHLISKWGAQIMRFLCSEVMWNSGVQSSKSADHRQKHRHLVCWNKLHDSSPGIPYWHQGDITIWAHLQDAVLWLYPDPKELDVLRCVCTHTRVLLHTGAGKIRETTLADQDVITSHPSYPNVLAITTKGCYVLSTELIWTKVVKKNNKNKNTNLGKWQLDIKKNQA